MKVFKKPYHLFALSAVILIMLSLIPFNHSMDLQVTGASYTLSYKYTLQGLGMLLLLLWVLHLFTMKILFSEILAWIHIVCTILVISLITYLFFRFAEEKPPEHQEMISIQGRVSARMLAPGLIMLLFLIQAMYLLNLLLGVIRRINRTI